MSRSLIFIGGNGPSRLEWLNREEYVSIIAADSGYDRARMLGIEPTLVIGDLDSTHLRNEIIAKGFIPCPHDKDDSDFVLALKKAEEDYDLIGGGEGRIDHMMAIFSAFHTLRPPKIWVTGKEILFCSSHFVAEVEKGTAVSFFPADLAEKGIVSTRGFVWDLKSHDLSLSFISLSNRAEDKRIEIECDKKLFIRFDLDFFQSGGKIVSC